MVQTRDTVLAHALKNKRLDQVRSDIAAVVNCRAPEGYFVIWAAKFTKGELAVDKFAKTSTGFGSGGATVRVALMRQTVANISA